MNDIINNLVLNIDQNNNYILIKMANDFEEFEKSKYNDYNDYIREKRQQEDFEYLIKYGYEPPTSGWD